MLLLFLSTVPHTVNGELMECIFYHCFLKKKCILYILFTEGPSNIGEHSLQHSVTEANIGVHSYTVHRDIFKHTE